MTGVTSYQLERAKYVYSYLDGIYRCFARISSSDGIIVERHRDLLVVGDNVYQV